LNNVAKHAQATRADVVLTSSAGQVALVVEDDGVGFEPIEETAAPSGIGLASMRERAALVGASLEVESVPTRGTSVFVKTRITEGGARR
jgi:signal transduction histidine kinase